MIRALIIDDEIAVRAGLLKRIHWSEIGIDQVEAVGNAEDALSYIVEKRPDIILSDIRLPGMDGIELCGLVREKQIACRIIFISGYCDIDYLKGAIRISAEDYIEKPIDIATVEECLQRTVAKCHNDREKLKKDEELQDFVGTHRENLMEAVVKKLIKGQWPETLIEQIQESQQKVGQDDFFTCMIIRVDREEAGINVDYSAMREEIYRFLEGVRFLCSVKDGRYLIFLIAYTQNEFLTKVFRLFEELEEKICKKGVCSRRIFVSVSDRAKGYNSIPRLYAQASALQQKLFFMGFDKLAAPKDEGSGNLDFSRISLNGYKASLGEREEDIVREANEIYKQVAEQMDTPPSVIKNVYFEMNYLLFQELNRGEGEVQWEEDMEKGVLWEKISSLQTIEECHENLLYNISQWCRNREALISENRQVLLIVKYIQKHFRNQDLSINQIAEAMNLSTSYLSTFFRKQTGSTISQMIRDMRLNYSLTLLENPELTLAEIAVRCGYDNQNYWAKVFKKALKMSPSEYREKMMK